MTTATPPTPPNPSEDPLVRIEQKLDLLSSDWDRKFDSIERKVETLSYEMERSNDKFDNYQKATQWVVQLAFTLIASATITVIVSSVLSR